MMDGFLNGGGGAVDHWVVRGEWVVCYLQNAQNVKDDGVRA